MDVQTDAGELPASDIVQIPAGEGDRTSLREAARTLASFRHKQRDAGNVPGDASARDSRQPSQDDVAPPDAAAKEEPQAASGEAQPAAEAAAAERAPATDAMPGDAPASWSREDQERFKSLPRETRDYLAARDQERERAVRRGHDEIAAERKTVEVERQKMGEARHRYEQALPALVQSLSQQQAVDFADIKDVADVERLAREDWPRYVQWDAQQKRIASAVRQMEAAQARQAQERRAELEHFIKREQELFVEKAPEIADEAQRTKLQHAAVDMLKWIGFAETELAQLWRGERDLSVHDHRLQLLVRDGIRWRDAQQKAKDAAARPVPPVVRPGVAQGKGAAQDAAISNLTRRLDQTGNLKDAARLIAERRRAG